MSKIPSSSTQLLQKAKDIAGLSLAELATQLNLSAPSDLLHHKGWVGQLIEQALGASAGSKPEPDFPKLGIELKTIPINERHLPSETTFVCAIPLLSIQHETWETSLVRKKLARVLWIPVEASKQIPLKARRIGMPLLWEMDEVNEAFLRADWEELTNMICLGKLEMISARFGKYLHIRPKGPNAKALCWAIGEDGYKIKTLPRGFYLRVGFTQQILEGCYCL